MAYDDGKMSTNANHVAADSPQRNFIVLLRLFTTVSSLLPAVDIPYKQPTSNMLYGTILKCVMIHFFDACWNNGIFYNNPFADIEAICDISFFVSSSDYQSSLVNIGAYFLRSLSIPLIHVSQAVYQRPTRSSANRSGSFFDSFLIEALNLTRFVTFFGMDGSSDCVYDGRRTKR
ncbi:hypothetical protein M422DRAFT_253696 [Sphaerobolus stellatus SS14]|uniref:Uncharacterized protein n=1 Tax=Sphaerobolus stellatus (strain SS14) TaxID=990650 RepID=A0A0C9VWJ3_SPHS4|nr:hypothetical protein M422DRAFT_253696 [Sphaerobolus stellatus SS14]